MNLSVFDLFRIGIGPSSSHTVGPMRACRFFAAEALAGDAVRVTVRLHGSLGATGRGHRTDEACLLGLAGLEPERAEPEAVRAILVEASRGRLMLMGRRAIAFDAQRDIVFAPEELLPLHTNGMTVTGWNAQGGIALRRCYYSVGGGFVTDGEGRELSVPGRGQPRRPIPHPFASSQELLSECRRCGLTVAALMRENEEANLDADEVDARLERLWSVMCSAIERGLHASGELAGGLHLARRAPQLWHRICSHPEFALQDPLAVLDWVNAFAMAVSEENAAGGQVVTAPTNGAAGTVPAVGRYLEMFVRGISHRQIHNYLLTAGAIGLLYKANASISGAEVGCQGEVGVACSMAAGGLCAALGGSIGQVEDAAEIAMEHCLGLTCDPVLGLVQVPCIERNAVAAVKAINAARLALSGTGKHLVSLDAVMCTMMATGRDMASKYKETSRGGLAVCRIEC